MGLLDKFFGGSSSGKRSGGTSLMDRFMNPMTQSGLALLGGNDPAQAAQVAQQYQQNKSMQQLAAGITDPHERAMLMMAPQAYVSAKMKRPGAGANWASADGRLYNKATGEWKDNTGPSRAKSIMSPSEITKEFKLGDYPADVAKRALETGDISELEGHDFGRQKEVFGMTMQANKEIEAQIAPLRTVKKNIDIARKMFEIGAGPTDFIGVIGTLRAVEPNSTVMRGESKALEESSGYWSNAQRIANLGAEKGFLTKAERKAMYKALDGLEEVYSGVYSKTLGHYKDSYSNKFGLDRGILGGAPISWGGGYTPENIPEDAAIGDIGKTFKEKAGAFLEGFSAQPDQSSQQHPALKPGERGTPENPIIVKRVNGKLVEMP